MTIKEAAKNPKSYIIGLFLLFGGDKAYEWIFAGAESEIITIVDNRIDAKFTEYLTSSGRIKAALSTNEVKEFADSTSVRIAKKVEQKVGNLKALAKELGIRDEDLEPLMVTLLTAFKEGKIMTEQQFEDRFTERFNEELVKFANKRRTSSEAKF